MYLKDPQAVLDYRVDWTEASVEGQAILASQWLVEPAHPDGLAVELEGLADRLATVRLAGGVAGMLYRVVNRVIFSDGSVDERTLALRVENR